MKYLFALPLRQTALSSRPWKGSGNVDGGERRGGIYQRAAFGTPERETPAPLGQQRGPLQRTSDSRSADDEVLMQAETVQLPR